MEMDGSASLALSTGLRPRMSCLPIMNSGGECACATCHVYLDPPWLEKTGTRSAMEESMLDFAEGVEANSRLSCQIKVTDALEGLVVTMPESQH
jgi:2Fe-2S ferredoxin